MLRKLTALFVACILLLSVPAALADDLLATVLNRGKLTIATEGEWAPWTYHDETDALVGFDVEVAQAIAGQLGVEADFVEGPWSGILQGVDNGMYDIAANGVEITEERSEKYDFSVPYAYLHTVLIVRGDNEDIKSFEDLKGKRTVNSAGSTYAMIAEDYGAEAAIVDDLARTIEAVLLGTADATLNAEDSFGDYMREHPDANLKVVARSEEASPVGIPMRKGAENAAFLAALNGAIEALRADGTLNAISMKYFNTDITAAE